eukprot:946329_1
MARNLTRLLCDRIDNAQSVHDMLPLLSLIPLQVIREVIVDTIRDLDTDIVNKMQYTCLSMTEIIPCDVIQQIVSFTDSLHLKYVDKTFNVAHNRNQTLHGLSQRQNIIDQYSFAPTLKHGAATWIIHPTRTHLTSDEIANRYQGPLNTFMDVMNAARSGDKLLFHDGNYGSTDEYDIILLFENLNNLQFLYDDGYFKCIANVFKDNLGYPIAVDVSGEPKRSKKLEIKQNILEGYNGISANDTVDSANKIY